MDNQHISDIQRKSELEAEAILLFPYPSKCKWVRAKIDWKRDNWVKERLSPALN